MAFGLRRAKVLGYFIVQLVSKISNLCGPDPATSQTDKMDGPTTCILNTALCTSASRGKERKGKGMDGKEISQNRYISCICGEAPVNRF